MGRLSKRSLKSREKVKQLRESELYCQQELEKNRIRKQNTILVECSEMSQIRKLKEARYKQKLLKDSQSKQLHLDRVHKRLLNPVVKEMNRTNSLNNMRKRLQDLGFKTLNQRNSLNSMRKRLKDPKVKQINQINSLNTMRKRLQNPEFKELNKINSLNTMRKRLQNPEFKELNKINSLNTMRKRLQNPEFKELNKINSLNTMRKRLQNPEFKELHKFNCLKSMRKRLKNPEYKELNKINSLNTMRKRLQNPEFKEMNKINSLNNMRKRLKDPRFRRLNQINSLNIMRLRLKDPRFRKMNRISSLKNITKRRKNSVLLHNDRIVNCQNMRKRRLGSNSSWTRNTKNKKKIPSTTQYRKNERQKLNEKRQSENVLITEYKSRISQGLTEKCFSCYRLRFPTSIHNCKKYLLNRIGIEISNIDGDTVPICTSCLPHIRKSKIPPLYIENGYKLNSVPPSVTKLNQIEKQMVALRLPFMKIFKCLRSEGQLKIKGNIVNVPIDLTKTTSILPRRAENLAAIKMMKVKLKRKACFKQHYLYQNVRPSLVITALNDLVKKPLYKDAQIDQDWLAHVSKSIQTINDPNENQDTDDEDEDLEPINPGAMDTMIENCDYVSFAPGEGMKPLSILIDDHAEEKAFPDLFGGCPRKHKTPLKHYSKIVRSELLNVDRRFAADTANLFFKDKVLIQKQIVSNIATILRKSKMGNITASDVANPEILNKMIDNDQGYRMLHNVQNSPSYLAAMRKNVFAMVRQEGQPTLFLTFSPSESTWTHLLKNLYKIHYNETITDDKADKLTYDQKSDLIRRDPVACATYFDHRFRAIFKLIRSKNVIFKEHSVDHFFYRVEYQHRGSPHVHMLLWLKNAPVFDPAKPETFTDCVTLIDKYITCMVDEDSEAHKYIQKNTHRHTHTCYRSDKDKENKKCRFNIPYPPMNETCILTPLIEDNSNPSTRKIRLQQYDKLVQYLRDYKDIDESKEPSLDEILQTLSINSINEYKSIIRTAIKRPTVFLKRTIKQRMISGFNKDLFPLWQSNMDVQYILDTYSCVRYVIEYIGKSQRGISKLMRDIVENLKTSTDMPVKEQLWKIATSFSGSQEISAQEAVYNCLGMKQSNSSTGHIFINTSHPDKRTRMLKPKAVRGEMNPQSNDIYVGGLLEHYSCRPSCLEHVSLAEFGANFEVRGKTKPTNNLSSDNDTHETVDESKNYLKCNMLYVGCSRATSAQGLCIDNFPAKPPKPSIKVVNEMSRLRTPSCTLNPLFSEIQTNNKPIYCLSHNIRSLKKYEDHINADKIILQSHLMFFQETGSKPSDVYNIKYHNECCRIDSIHKNGKSGSICFIGESISHKKITSETTLIQEKSTHLEAIEICIENITYIGIYASPKFPVEKLCSFIEKLAKTYDQNVIIGDFNINFNKLPKIFVQLLNNLNYKILVNEITTDYGTNIDNVLTNVEIGALVYESLISDHRPILVLDKETCTQIKNKHEVQELVDIVNSNMRTSDNGIKEISKNIPNELKKPKSKTTKELEKSIPNHRIDNHNDVFNNIEFVQESSNTLRVNVANMNNRHTNSWSQTNVTTEPNNDTQNILEVTNPKKVIHGFTNNDNVSCYANSVIQVLFHCESLVQKIHNNELGPTLRQSLEQYESNQISETFPIRQYLDNNEYNIYTQREQQDCVQFLEALMNRHRNTFNTLFGFHELYHSHCNLCNHITSNNAPMSLIKHLNIPESRVLSLEQLLAIDQNSWSSILDYRCSNCNNVGGFERKSEIALAKEYIIIQLKLFATSYINGEFLSSKITNLKLKEVSNANLIIAESHYKPYAAIFHIGNDTNSGHYTAYLKQSDNKWVCVNDSTINEKRWPNNGKDVYVIILKRV